MNRTKRLQGPCEECGGILEFPADLIGTTSTCPHCGKTTELRLFTPPEEPTVPRRMIVYVVIALFVLLAGLGGSLVALQKARSMVARQKPAAVQSETNAPSLSP
jgi:hypothetical protein